jgi:hypothetical protein
MSCFIELISSCRVECVRRRRRARSPGGAGIIEPNEQLISTSFPCHSHPASGNPLRDLPAHRGLQARHPRRGADRALSPGLSRSARPSRPVGRSPPHHPRWYVTGGNCPGPRAPADTECGRLRWEPAPVPADLPRILVGCSKSWRRARIPVLRGRWRFPVWRRVPAGGRWMAG